ncbi:uncharacterized protein [Palaemon carinicauda]|uniref:uncharacterized protein n=1 Tax=Palaemon carinicauda TaxID=392227 RepID=UPI0035B65BC5
MTQCCEVPYGVSRGTCGVPGGLFVPEVCEAIIDTYQHEFLKCPKTPEEWKTVAEVFANKWNYHNCIRALDGKHVPIKKPRKLGSLYYFYKKFHSIILIAVADAKYKFLYIDVGAEGGAGNGGAWSKYNLHHAIEQN